MLLHEITRRLRDRARLNREIRRVRAFDDRLLADMGIPRKDIAAFVRGVC